MKANELRIGNLVLHDKRFFKIFTVIDSGKDPIVRAGNDITGKFKIYKEYFLSDLSPIPLTEEWLIKMEFYRCDQDIQYHYRYCKSLTDKFGMLFEWKKNMFTYGYVGNPTEVKYVHQLQNLYFALTGEELECR